MMSVSVLERVASDCWGDGDRERCTDEACPRAFDSSGNPCLDDRHALLEGLGSPGSAA
jgi:hypothetical protein